MYFMDGPQRNVIIATFYMSKNKATIDILFLFNIFPFEGKGKGI